MIGDLEVRQAVLDELDFEPSVNAAHIGVTANKGVVTLTGFVSSFAEKAAAERAARRVKGVRAIAQEIDQAGDHRQTGHCGEHRKQLHARPSRAA